ncbi:MAG: ABC transporter permease [Oscillospiraceae bacterium]
MYKLIRLELKRNKLKPYYTALVIISIVMTGFLYLIATIAKVEKVELFSEYGNILKMHTVITFIVFSVFSVVLFSKFVIEDYSRQRALLLFSYPVSRTKIFAAKLILVSGFITAGFLVSTLIPNILFFITESFAPILGGNIRASIVLAQLMNVISFILAILSIGFISLRIGFINKSVSGTIVTAILLAAVLGNVLMGLGASIYAFIGVIIFFAIGLGFAKSTNNQINKMEV